MADDFASTAKVVTPLAWLRRRSRLPFILGGGLLLIWLLLSRDASTVGPIVTVDVEQQRADVMLPIPRGGVRIRQSFYAHWDGLREIELIAARTGQPKAEESGVLRLQLVDDSGIVVAEETLATGSISHNQTLLFRFPKQTHSAGRRFQILLSGNEFNRVSVWGYSMDVLSEGRLIVSSGALQPEEPATDFGELRFLTRTQLSWTDAFISLTTTLHKEGAILLLALLVVPMPGAVLLLLPALKIRRWDPPAWWGTAAALGIAVWPLIWLVLTLLGGRWRGWLLWLFLVFGWGAALILWIRQRRSARGQNVERKPADTTASFPVRYLRGMAAWNPQQGLLWAILLTALAVRLLAIRGQAFPAWVDSSRHALITSVMVEQGRFPSDYRTLLPVERTPYHYGFHTLPANLLLLVDWPVNRLLLAFGQLLNGFLPLSVYAAVWLMTRRRDQSLLAAFLVALPFFFPAYYVAWGRYTQLAAMFILPPLLALTWLIVRGGRRWRRLWWVVGAAAAGLFLVHFRVFLFYIPIVAIIWLISLGRNGRRLAAAGGLALLLSAPRIVQLLEVTEPLAALSSNITNYNAFPISYVRTGWERVFIFLAIPGLFVTVVFGLKRRPWTALPLALCGWVALLFLLLSGEKLGLPETSLVNLNSMYITLFLPLSIFLSVTAGQAWLWFRSSHRLFEMIGSAIAGAALTAALLFGVRQQITILNPQTILARAADQAALDWVDRRLPQDAVFAVNSWMWLGNTWAGSDGGAWLLPTTARTGTTPPVDYIYGRELRQYVSDFNDGAADISDWSTAAAANWLRQQQVTHVFIGVRGGQFDPAALARNPDMRMVYGRDGAFVFALTPG